MPSGKDLMHVIPTPGALAKADMGQLFKMAQMIATANICPSHFKGQPGSVLMVMAGALELGVSWYAGLQSAHVINGKVGWSAEFLEALAKGSPRCRKLYLKSVNDSEAVYIVQTVEMDEPVEVGYTLKMADAAGLLKVQGSAWSKHRQDMLVARARARAVRRYFPEVCVGQRTVEELHDLAAAQGVTVKMVATMDPKATSEEKLDAVLDMEPAEETVEPTPEQADAAAGMFELPKEEPPFEVPIKAIQMVADKVGKNGRKMVASFCAQNFNKEVKDLNEEEYLAVDDFLKTMLEGGS